MCVNQFKMLLDSFARHSTTAFRKMIYKYSKSTMATRTHLLSFTKSRFIFRLQIACTSSIRTECHRIVLSDPQAFDLHNVFNLFYYLKKEAHTVRPMLIVLCIGWAFRVTRYIALVVDGGACYCNCKLIDFI